MLPVEAAAGLATDLLAGATLSSLSLRSSEVAVQVRAATAAGFGGIGCHARSFAEGRFDYTSLVSAISRWGIEVREVEVLRPWSDDPEARRLEDAASILCDRFGATYVQVCGPHGTTVERAAESFARLCDRFATLGARCGLEFLPFTDIPDPAAAAAIVELADRPNGGICVDAWHMQRLGLGPDDLRRHAHRIISLQLSDGPAQPVASDPREDCLKYRRVPGEGDFDLAPLVRFARGLPQLLHLSVEVLSVDLDHLGADRAATRIAEGTRRCLA